jgi:hypothetical protein
MAQMRNAAKTWKDWINGALATPLLSTPALLYCEEKEACGAWKNLRKKGSVKKMSSVKQYIGVRQHFEKTGNTVHPRIQLLPAFEACGIFRSCPPRRRTPWMRSTAWTPRHGRWCNSTFERKRTKNQQRKKKLTKPTKKSKIKKSQNRKKKEKETIHLFSRPSSPPPPLSSSVPHLRRVPVQCGNASLVARGGQATAAVVAEMGAEGDAHQGQITEPENQ